MLSLGLSWTGVPYTIANVTEIAATMHPVARIMDLGAGIGNPCCAPVSAFRAAH
jgi:hypothetical protein